MNIDLTKVSNNLSVIEHYRVSNNVNYYQGDFSRLGNYIEPKSEIRTHRLEFTLRA